MLRGYVNINIWLIYTELASFPGFPRFYLSFVFTIIHGSGRPFSPIFQFHVLLWTQMGDQNGGRPGTEANTEQSLSLMEDQQQRECMWCHRGGNFCICILLYMCCHLERQWNYTARPILQFCFEEHVFSFNFILWKDLVKSVNIPVQERNATCRIVASAGSSIR